MFGSALIVFRESLEAALLIGIIAASTRGLTHRNQWLTIGIAAGVLGALAVAGLTESIAEMAGGSGQELFNASIQGIAVLMIAWHNIWMASHGKEMANRAKSMGLDIRSGKQALSAVAIACALTVLREGSETALFMQGMLTTTSGRTGSVMIGGLLGLLAGISVGFVAYFGLLRISLRYFFSVTNALLLLLAAGLAGQMAKFLIQADLLPSLATPLWDTSWLLPDASGPGAVLHISFGYEARPTGMQAIFYLATLVCIAAGAYWVHRHAETSSYKLKSA